MRRFKFWGSVVLSTALILSTFVFGAGAQPNEQQIRVLIQVDGPDAGKAQLKATYGERWNFAERGFTTDVTQGQLLALQKMNNVSVKIVEQAHTMDAMVEKKAGPGGGGRIVPSDSTPWGIEAIYNDPSITATFGGSGIRVAVLDTGGLQDHPDLVQNAEQCKDFSQNRSPMIDGKCEDKNGHGTHVSGTILANGGADGLGIWGVAPGSKLWSYKVLGNSGFGYSDDIAAAIRHAADEGQRLGVNVVISMSLGSSTNSDLIADAVTYANSKGALVVAAAGNSGPDPDTIGYPGGLANAIGVAALENVLENGTYRVADFSSRGNPDTAGDYVIVERDVEVSAPGRNVESTWNDGGYNTISGTSMATPHISGLVAKIWAANPGWSNANVRNELQSRATNNDILGGLYAGPGDDIASGFGFPRVE